MPESGEINIDAIILIINYVMSGKITA